MKKILTLFSFFLIVNVCFGQAVGDDAKDYTFAFVFPDIGSVNNFEWTYTDKTLGCTLSSVADATLIANELSAYDSQSILGTNSIFSSTSCGLNPKWGDDMEFSAVITAGPHSGKTMRWAGKLDNTTLVVVLEFEVPAPTITISPVTLCEGETGKTVLAKLKNAPTGFTIDWGNANITTGATTDTTAVGNIGTGLTAAGSPYNLTAELKDNTGTKVADVNYTVTVKAKPTITIAPATLCAGKQITATGGGTYKWTAGAGATGSTAAKVTPTATGNYTVEVIKDGCTASKTEAITVNPLPTVTIQPVADADMCKGESLTLTANASGGSATYTQYTWTPGGTTTTNTKTVAVNNGANNYTVKVKDNKGCESTASAQVTVTGHEVNATLTANPASVTNGGTSQLTAGPTGMSYDWSLGDAVTGTGNVVTTPALTANGNYSVVVEDAYGCKDTASATVTVTGGALAIDPKDKTVCSAALPATLDAGESGGSGTYTYSWTAPAGVNLSSTSAQYPNVLGTSTPGTYTISVTVTDAVTLRSESGTLQLVINETPTLTGLTATPATVTSGNTSTLSVTVSPSTASLTWSGGTVTPATGSPVTTAALTTTTTYTVTADNNNCKATDQVTVTVNAPGVPLAVVPPTVPPTGAVNTPINSCVNVSGGDCGGNYSYNWSSSAAGVTVTPGVGGCATVTATTPGTKEVCVTVTCGTETENACFNVNVTSGPTTPPVLAWTITDKVCANSGDKRTITLTASGGGDQAKYSFILSDKNARPVKTVTEEAGPSWTWIVSAAEEGTYTVSGFSAKASDGTVTTGSITPGSYIDANFYPVPVVSIMGMTAGTSVINNCSGDQLVLEGTGTANDYKWDDGTKIFNGVPFVPAGSGQHILYSKNEFGCSRQDTVQVVVNPKPEVQLTVQGTEICPGESVVLNATATLGATVTWNNGVVSGVPFQPAITGVYTATATIAATGCSISKDTTVVVKEKPVIVRHSKNPRNIAIGKDVYFAVEATGAAPLTYEWYRKVNNVWTLLGDNSISQPTVAGSRTDSLILKTVPKIWDGSEFKVIVRNDCDTASMVFQLGVKECFDIEIKLLMQEGIMPDTDPVNKIDGWYCRGQRIALRAELTSPEGYDIENTHFKWTIDGLELPEEHYELETDTCVLTWIPEYQEDDIVVKVCGYSDGACEEVCARYLRLKAREFAKVSLDLLTSVDPEHSFCPGDTVDFWVATKNAGDSARFDWYNDIFHLPSEPSPKNELISYEGHKLTMVMGQEDTWMKVYLTPSKEVCTDQPTYVDTVFLKKKEWVSPSLKIANSIDDTVACQGDELTFWAVYENAGSNPTFNWRKDIWDWSHDPQIKATLEDKDMWLRCELIPGNDVCYDGRPLTDTMVIRVLENPTVTIFADLTDKQPGDEIIVESEVVNMPVNAHYTWYLNYDYEITSNDYPEYISDRFNQGDIIQCAVSGEQICTSKVFSNELVINFGNRSRDTMVTIYQGEWIHNMDMRHEGDQTRKFHIVTEAKWGVGTMNPAGKFSYTPNAGFVGSDMVKYEVVDKFTGKTETGYIYITVMDRKRYFIPNIITPNGDGLNDTWKLDFLSEYPDHHITIYNRDGVVVFEATNYQNDWDGTGTNKNGYISHFNLANGIYTYVINLGNKEILKNWLEIRRDMNRGKYKY